VTSEEGAAPGAVPLDREAARVASGQFGVITYAQLRACGLSRDRVEQRVKAGQLQRLWQGVYAFGHRELTREGRLIAAVLACGEGAVLSHRSAAQRWELLPTAQTNIDITVPTRAGRANRPGIHLHCCRRLDPADLTTRGGIPVTTVARTLVDLATSLTPHQTERVVHRAVHLRLLDTRSLDEQLARAQGRRTTPLQAAIEQLQVREPDITRTLLEERFLELVVDAQLPRPEVNAMVGEHEVGFLWRAERLIVETDGASTHLTAEAFEEDRRRDAVHAMLGFRTLRFTWRQVVYEPRFVARAITAAVAG